LEGEKMKNLRIFALAISLLAIALLALCLATAKPIRPIRQAQGRQAHGEPALADSSALGLLYVKRETIAEKLQQQHQFLTEPKFQRRYILLLTEQQISTQRIISLVDELVEIQAHGIELENLLAQIKQTRKGTSSENIGVRFIINDIETANAAQLDLNSMLEDEKENAVKLAEEIRAIESLQEQYSLTKQSYMDLTGLIRTLESKPDKLEQPPNSSVSVCTQPDGRSI
jgi:vacuolar-type H+-ATPase subunit I/STV1